MSGLKRIHRSILPVILVWLLAGVGCNLPGTRPEKPLVEVQSPESGSTVPVGEPLVISATATDPTGPGVMRVEVFVAGESIRLIESPTGPQDVLDVATTLTPEAEGRLTINLIAYRRDGTPSAPATLVLNVVGMTREPAQAVAPTVTITTPTRPPSGAPTSTVVAGIQGRVETLTNIRSGPGPFCDIVGSAEAGDLINLLELSKDELWYKTDFLGRTGWIYVKPVTQLDDEDVPVGNATGCKGCGDKSCNLEETCDTCPEDCGLCCGNALCEPHYGEDCATCEADCGPCCGNAVCEPGRGEDCGTCQADCGPCCGNAVCEPSRGETCGTCQADCGSCCGNSLCEDKYGEDCNTCPKDCGKCCGNGLCEKSRGETCNTCPKDCGKCAPVCGDGHCDKKEDCDTCPADCGVCPAECGDGTCDPGEDCTTCPQDCGEC
jgi:hypothetical protein